MIVTLVIQIFFLILLVFLFSEADESGSLLEFDWRVWRIRDGLRSFAITFGGTPLLEVSRLLNSGGLKGSELRSEMLFLGKKTDPPNF